MLNLRNYQNKIVHDARELLRQVRSVLIQVATGGGKTVLGAKMLGSASERGARCFFIVHRQELVDQTAKTFDKVGIQYGIIAAGYSRNPFPMIQICMIQTLAGKLDLVKAPDLIVFDEAHHMKSRTWQKVADYFEGAKLIGLSATPKRLDGKGLGDIFDKMIEGPPMGWLMDQGFLSDYKYFAPNGPDTSHLHSQMGDFNKKETAELMDNSKIIGDAVAHYQEIASGKSALVFCSSIEHSLHTMEQFRQQGYTAQHLDGKTKKGERRKILEDFRNKKFEILCNVDLIGEGVDIVGAEVAVLLRPTKSLTIYLQQVGRVLRPDPSKPYAIILDHAGNVFRHGLPDAERDWSLTYTSHTKKRASNDDGPALKQCAECFCTHEPAPVCPECGYEYPVMKRDLEQEEGQLVEIDRAALKQQKAEAKRQATLERKREQTACKTLEELQAFAKKRGYTDNWADNIWAFRQGKRR